MQKSPLYAWRWFHIVPIMLSFACLAGWGWLSKHGSIVSTDNSYGSASLERKSMNANCADKLSQLEFRMMRSAPKIFLLWTTAPGTFKERNYDVLEAYFYHHPNAEITIYASELESRMFERFVQSGYNLLIVTVNDEFIKDLSKHCPGQTWVANLEKWKSGPYYYSHITDYVRFCLLYKNGGIYSDFDAILINPINQHDNFIGKDSSVAKGRCKWCLPGGDMYLVN
jgi:hypothetical protein